MGISPWCVGQTRPTWAFTWLDDSKNAINLTGATVVLRFCPAATLSEGYTPTGVVTITNAAAGQFTYAPAVGDFAAAGNYDVQAKATFGDGTVIECDLLQITVNAAV